MRSAVVRRLTVLGFLACLLGIGPTFAAAAGNPTGGPSGPDVASYQHPSGAAINWGAVRNSGQRWGFVKATEGTTYTNPYFAGDWRGAAAAGLYRGAYHYARPSASAGSAAAQARFFANTIGPQLVPGTLPPILDLEDSGGLSPAALVGWVSQFLRELQADTGRLPMIYTYPNFWRNAMAGSTAFTGYPLWIASYGVSTPQTLGWGHWTFWQYTSSGTVDGIVTAGATDISVFNGTSLDLAALALAGSWGPASSTASDGGGGAAVRTTPPNSRYVAVPPQRFVDTRSGQGARPGPVAGSVTVQVPPVVPPEASAVVLDVSAVAPRETGWLRVSPAGSPPTTTALNFVRGHGSTGLVVTATDAQRRVDIATYGGSADLTVDLVGYYATTPGLGGHWMPITPIRAVDTRSGQGAPVGPVKGDLTFRLPSSVPADAAAVALDITAVDPGGDGYLRVAAAGMPATTTALNFQGGGSTTGLALTTSTSGNVTVAVAGSPSQLVVDVVGFYEGNASDGSGFVAVAPQRFVDTRSGLAATGPGRGPLAVTLPGVVPRNATAVLLDVSLVSPDRKGYLRLAAPGTPATTTALNAMAGAARTGLVLSGLRDGQITLGLYGSNAQLVIDLLGYQTAPPQPTASPAPSP